MVVDRRNLGQHALKCGVSGQLAEICQHQEDPKTLYCDNLPQVVDLLTWPTGTPCVTCSLWTVVDAGGGGQLKLLQPRPMANRDLAADTPVLLLLEWLATHGWHKGKPPTLHTEGSPQVFSGQGSSAFNVGCGPPGRVYRRLARRRWRGSTNFGLR